MFLPRLLSAFGCVALTQKNGAFSVACVTSLMFIGRERVFGDVTHVLHPLHLVFSSLPTKRRAVPGRLHSIDKPLNTDPSTTLGTSARGSDDHPTKPKPGLSGTPTD